MVRSRVSAALLPLLALIAATAHAGTEPVNFGVTELGQIKINCFRLIGPGQVASIATSPPYFVRGVRIGSSSLGDDICDNTPGLSTPTTLPRTLGANQQIAFDVDLVPIAVSPSNNRDLSVNNVPIWTLMANIVGASDCNLGNPTVNCLNDDRFKVRAHWRTTFGTRGAGPAVQNVGSDDSGLFYFFNPDNWEVLIKVLDACNSTQPRFWVFAAATTNVEYTITVTDTQEQVARSYFKPQGPPSPAITDTNAFATCP